MVISHRGSRSVPRGVEKGQLCSRLRDFTLLAGGGVGGSPKTCVSEITASTLSAASFSGANVSIKQVSTRRSKPLPILFKRVGPAENRRKKSEFNCEEGFVLPHISNWLHPASEEPKF